MKQRIMSLQFCLIINLICPLNLLGKQAVAAKRKPQKQTAAIKKTKPKGKVKEIHSEKELIATRPTVLELYSQTCGPCIMFAKTYDKYAAKYSDIQFLKAEGTKVKSLSKKYKIKAFPTFIFILNNIDKPHQVVLGASKSKVEDAIIKLQAAAKKGSSKRSAAKPAKKKAKAKPSGVRNLSSMAELDKLIKETNGLVVAEYHAEAWCGACKMFSGPFAELANDHDDVAVFVKLDDMQDGNKEIAKKHGVTALPTTLIFKGGKPDKPVDTVVGASKEKLDKSIRKVAKKSEAKSKAASKKDAKKPAAKKENLITHVKSKKEFEALVQNSDVPVVVDYHAESWCGACQMYKDIFGGFATQHPKLKFVKVDHQIQENQAIANEYNVAAFPTTLIFENGQKTKEIVGIDVAQLQNTFEELNKKVK